MLGWGLHFVPFLIMGRVLYVHHYMPALYFAMLVLSYEVELFVLPLGKQKSTCKKLACILIYLTLYAMVAGVFYRWRHISFGMEGPKENYAHLDLLPSWRIGNDNYI